MAGGGAAALRGVPKDLPGPEGAAELRRVGRRRIERRRWTVGCLQPAGGGGGFFVGFLGAWGRGFWGGLGVWGGLGGGGAQELFELFFGCSGGGVRERPPNKLVSLVGGGLQNYFIFRVD